MKNSVKPILQLTELTEQEIRNENREYNAAEWDKVINRAMQMKDCKFYKATPQRGYGYTRYFAVYEIPEGIRLFQSISYSSSLTSNGFVEIEISDTGEASSRLVKFPDGLTGRVKNNNWGRHFMAVRTQTEGRIYSNEF